MKVCEVFTITEKILKFLNVEAVVAAFNQENALVVAVIVQLCWLIVYSTN